MRKLELARSVFHLRIEAHRVGIVGRQVEPLSQQRHLLIHHAELEQGTVRDDVGGLRRGVHLAASKLDQLFPERLELRLVRLEAPQIGGRVRADGDQFDHLGRIGQGGARRRDWARAARG